MKKIVNKRPEEREDIINEIIETADSLEIVEWRERFMFFSGYIHSLWHYGIINDEECRILFHMLGSARVI